MSAPKYIRLLFALASVMVMLSCREDWSFSDDGRFRLGFSSDTIKMDTVFTDMASVSQRFLIYNRNDMGLRFDAVMSGGKQSCFRMNLDGEGGTALTGLEIPAGDSLFCFVTVNIPSTTDLVPFRVTDSICFILESGNIQTVKLEADGQNAVRLKGIRVESDTMLTADVPYIIYDSLYVAQGASLTLQPGARLFFHKNAYLDVAGRIIAQGKPDSVITMRGDRLDDMLPDLPYDLLDDQWGGIILRSDSYDNSFEWCDIHGGDWGVRADSSSWDRLKLNMVSSVIHNVKGNALEEAGCSITVANSQITNAGKSCVALDGGSSTFIFCTIAALPVFSGSDHAVVLSDRTNPLLETRFINCIITGRHASEFVTELADSVKDTAPYMVRSSLLMVRDTTDSRFVEVRFENWGGKTYGAWNFKDHAVRGYRSVFELDSLSAARGLADTLCTVWPSDLAGAVRPPSGADAGCYQYKYPE